MYQLVRHNVPAMEGSWWIEGPGVYRPATDIEVSICKNAVDRALAAVEPFSAYVNIAAIGNTPESAIRKAFGIT